MANNPEIKITVASVKVMRSFDYCHFEVNLSTTLDGDMFTSAQDINPLKAVDDLRKEAARLADKAVEQYKVAKANAAKRETKAYERGNEIHRMEFIRGIAEGDRTVNQQAQLKEFDDRSWSASRRYDYEDDWDENE